jgi:hypothetical protein
MKETLEYKILEYLSKNDNGNYIDISFLSDNKNLMSNKIIELKRLEYLTFYPLTSINSSIPLPIPKCKIHFAGKKFLSENEIKNKEVTNQFNNSTIGHFNQDSIFLKSPINIKTKAAPSSSPEIKSRALVFFSNPWVIGLSLAIITAIFNGNRFMSFINNIFDNF